MNDNRIIRIGAGAGYSGDRIEPAIELAEKGDLDYLCFECLAERTIAVAQAARRADPQAGFDRLLRRRFEAVLPAARTRGTRIVTNMGAANPKAAADAVVAIAREMGIAGLKVTAVLGDDVLDRLDAAGDPLIDRLGTTADLGDAIVSANAYLGARPIAEALAQGADVVITGRVGDPALFLGPLIHEFGWAEDDWIHLGRGTILGHLLECAGQLTGGYFADPGIKDVPGLARLGFPIAEVRADGSAVLTKVLGSGGRLSVANCKEQLLYEILDPAAYLQPDVTADLTSVRFEALDENRIGFSGGGGSARPDRLKVSVGYQDGYIGEGQISYAGSGAVSRGRLAINIVRERLDLLGIMPLELSADLIGLDAVDRTGLGREPREVRARIAARTATELEAQQVVSEVEALYTNGPSGGGGAAGSVRKVLAVASTLIDRAMVSPRLYHGIA